MQRRLRACVCSCLLFVSGRAEPARLVSESHDVMGCGGPPRCAASRRPMRPTPCTSAIYEQNLLY
ncbi:hypothetical protein PF005_g3571 [Phytophthora fragariae]|uniref:Secreted protein n=2 Tax=Phytophthora TaxID=4783 RepID=A0A6A3TIL8_9STRA|nr:hypothetical protein PF009_g2224 [Phytophthora fragariae]KAE9026908.1 hypothetical protein PR001_g12094 [Phytophthora rubi]KAE9026174.1 hypothetical protein PF011_g2685 [Phytophthora fragariae]KAE9036842.1 hypothetical protein PR002_g6887 [Phytophthora rubi]KAE9132505.1 hypothetical protein PF010_g3162 [Phytophthora fragariae]